MLHNKKTFAFILSKAYGMNTNVLKKIYPATNLIISIIKIIYICLNISEICNFVKMNFLLLIKKEEHYKNAPLF